MPIDGHAYLVKQGWGGKGTGLRHGAIARPVTITQKKTLSGVGKDRDEAIPFWDHVFEAAAMSIQVKVSKDSDDDDSDSDAAPTPTLELQRTKTGMISHRQHKTGTPAVSGTGTPDSQASGSITPRRSVMAAAKQEAAKRMLYANFFRGPVLGPTDPDEASSSGSPAATTETAPAPEVKKSIGAPKKTHKKGKERATEPSPENLVGAPEKKRSKAETADEDRTSKEKRRPKREKETEKDEGERKEKKRRKRQAEQGSADEAGEKKRRKRDTEAGTEKEGEDRKAAKAERKQRNQEKQAAKEVRRRRKQEEKEAAAVDDGDGGPTGDAGEDHANDTSEGPAHLAPEDVPRKRRKRDKVPTSEESESRGASKKRRKPSSC